MIFLRVESHNGPGDHSTTSNLQLRPRLEHGFQTTSRAEAAPVSRQGRGTQRSLQSKRVATGWNFLSDVFWSLRYTTGGPQDLHNFPRLFSDRGTQIVADLMNLWPELLPDFHEAVFLLLREIQLFEVGDLLGNAIANHFLPLRSQVLERLSLPFRENALNLRQLIANEVL